MLFSIKSRKNLAQITVAAAMIALAIGVYTGHNPFLYLCYKNVLVSKSLL